MPPIPVYILISTSRGRAWAVCEAVSRLEGVRMAHSVTGPYDVIAYAEAQDLEAVKKLVERIHGIEGVERTLTALAL